MSILLALPLQDIWLRKFTLQPCYTEWTERRKAERILQLDADFLFSYELHVQVDVFRTRTQLVYVLKWVTENNTFLLTRPLLRPSLRQTGPILCIPMPYTGLNKANGPFARHTRRSLSICFFIFSSPIILIFPHVAENFSLNNFYRWHFHCSTFTFQLNSGKSVIQGILLGSQPFKIMPTFCGNRRSVTLLTITRHMSRFLST